MCDQTEVSYLPGDVVWVKLANVWWPAQVQDETKLAEDVTSGLRKKPLAVVKFFDEELFEFPKNLNQIYHYNCFKKDEFIKKGLDMCRPSGYRDISENMKKFPIDIKKAEILTGGNPDIIYDPKYLPEEKFDYREQFGLKPRKKTSKGSKRNSMETTPKLVKVKFSTPMSAPSTSRTPDTKISNASKSLSNPIKKTREIKKVASGSVMKATIGKVNESYKPLPKQFKCSYCNYRCGRMGVVIEHYRAHYRGNVFPSPSHIPHNYYKIFQENFVKYRNCVTSTPIALPKSGLEKVSVKRKISEESTPIKKRKCESVKKEKTPVATPGSSLAVPIKDIVGSSTTPKKRPRKSRETKGLTVKEPEALDILKDWEDDLDDETEIKLTNSESVEVNVNVREPSESKSESFSENEETWNPPPQDLKSQISKEKCCFDFEDNDESLSLNKSLKFGQKLPRVISEEKPTVQRLLKELQESKASSSKEGTSNEDFSEEFESLLKTTEVPKLPDIPQAGLAKLNENSSKKDTVKSENEKKDLELPMNNISSNQAYKSENFGTSKQLLTNQQSIELTETSEAFTVPKNDSLEESHNQIMESKNIFKKGDDILDTVIQEGTSFALKSISTINFTVSKNVPVIDSIETKEEEETEKVIMEPCISNDVPLDTSKASELITSVESNVQCPVNIVNKGVEKQNALLSLSEDSSLMTSIKSLGTSQDEMKEIFQNISKSEQKIGVFPSEEDVSNMSLIVDDTADNHSLEEVSCQEFIGCKTEETNKKPMIEKSNHIIQNSENIPSSGMKQLSENTENEDRLHNSGEIKFIENQNKLNPNSDEDTNINVTDGTDSGLESVELPLKEEGNTKSEKNLSANKETPADQIPFDINSMPIVIDQDPIMEIVEGHIEPLPNADIVRLYIRNRGEEEPEDFQSPKRLLTVSPPPPNMPTIPGIKKVTLPPPKNKNSASSSSTRFTLSKAANKSISPAQQQPKIVFIKSTTGAPNKLLIPQQQGSLFAPSGKLQPGTRILTTNAQLASKGQAQKKVVSKPILVGKQGFPTTAKIVQKPVIGQVLQKVPSQGIIGNKNTSAVIVSSQKAIVSRAVPRNVILTTPQLKNTAGVQISQTGGKLIRTAQVVKAQGTVFQQAEAVVPQKPLQSTSVMNENKKQSTKNKQPSPNILQRSQRKSARQQIVKKSQVLTIPSSVQQQTAGVVAVSNLPIVQSISSHSSSEPVKMLYLTVDNNQYSVENPVIPVENDNRNIFVTSTPSSGNIDNIIFSIDGTGNLVNISNQAVSSSSTHTPSQDILAKALADTQVLQSDTTDIVDNDSTVFVEQQYSVPSLSNTVLETSLTLNQPPIMSPLEVPSSVTPQSSISHIIPLTNITKKSDIQQPSMPLLTDEVEVPAQAVFLSDSGIPTSSGHLTFQLVHDNNLVVTSGLVQNKSSKLVTRNEGKQEYVSMESKEENVLPEFLKGNFGSKSESKKDTSPKHSER